MRYQLGRGFIPVIDSDANTNSFIYSYFFVYYCKNCGTEILGKFEYEPDSYTYDIKEACKRATNETDTCPVCKARLAQEKGFFMPDWNSSFEDYRNEEYAEEFGQTGYIDDILTFNALSELRKKEDSKSAATDVDDFIFSCDKPSANNNSKTISEIKNNSGKLSQYILHLLQMENNIYALKQRLNALYYQRILNNRDVVFGTYEPAFKVQTYIDELELAYQEALKQVHEAKTAKPKVNIGYPNKPEQPVLAKAGLFNKKKVTEENEKLIAEFNSAMVAYRAEVNRCDDIVAAAQASAVSDAQSKASEAKHLLDTAIENKEIRIKQLSEQSTPSKLIKELLDKEIAETETLLRKIFAVRNELYAYNIVFGKYRDAVALASFYEYLMAGRCTALEGANGAYNLYESDIRANIVIAKLERVITSLEDIKQNQYMMYSELRTINHSLTRLTTTMGKALNSLQSIDTHTARIADTTDVIAHNTAVTAYYSKVNAELTNALGYMIAFK